MALVNIHENLRTHQRNHSERLVVKLDKFGLQILGRALGLVCDFNPWEVFFFQLGGLQCVQFEMAIVVIFLVDSAQV